jgi:uncharacterized protein (TIGR00730 family)
MRWCVFCGSAPGNDPRFVAAATDLGRAFARHGIELVYGGGRVGLMGALADGVMDAGGYAIGVIPRALEAREVANARISDLRVVDSMHERKALMADLSDGFIALPGGFGTFEEFCEAVTWVQLGIQQKPCVLVNIAGYYDPLVALFDQGVTAGFIQASNRDIVQVVASVDALIGLITGAVRSAQ